MAHRIGLISDTHGQLPPAVHDIFGDVSQIIHAGDIGPENILIELESIAPVKAVYGNTDGWTIRKRFQKSLDLTIDDVQIIVAHKPWHLKNVKKDSKRITVEIAGHLHEPQVTHNGADLFVNPGSASHPRSGYKPSVAILTLENGKQPSAEIMFL